MYAKYKLSVIFFQSDYSNQSWVTNIQLASFVSCCCLLLSASKSSSKLLLLMLWPAASAHSWFELLLKEKKCWKENYLYLTFLFFLNVKEVFQPSLVYYHIWWANSKKNGWKIWNISCRMLKVLQMNQSIQFPSKMYNQIRVFMILGKPRLCTFMKITYFWIFF